MEAAYRYVRACGADSRRRTQDTGQAGRAHIQTSPPFTPLTPPLPPPPNAAASSPFPMGKDNALDLFEKLKDRPLRPSASYAAAAGAGGAYGSFAMASCCGAFLRCARVLFSKVNLESLDSGQPAFLREVSVRKHKFAYCADCVCLIMCILHLFILCF